MALLRRRRPDRSPPKHRARQPEHRIVPVGLDCDHTTSARPPDKRASAKSSKSRFTLVRSAPSTSSPANNGLVAPSPTRPVNTSTEWRASVGRIEPDNMVQSTGSAQQVPVGLDCDHTTSSGYHRRPPDKPSPRLTGHRVRRWSLVGVQRCNDGPREIHPRPRRSREL